jgi:hypothetical protein
MAELLVSGMIARPFKVSTHQYSVYADTWTRKLKTWLQNLSPKPGLLSIHSMIKNVFVPGYFEYYITALSVITEKNLYDPMKKPTKNRRMAMVKTKLLP